VVEKGKFEINPRVTIFARKVRAGGAWEAAFSYRPTRTPAQDDNKGD